VSPCPERDTSSKKKSKKKKRKERMARSLSRHGSIINLCPFEYCPICLGYPYLHFSQVWASVVPFAPGVLRVNHLDVDGSHQLFHHVSSILSAVTPISVVLRGGGDGKERQTKRFRAAGSLRKSTYSARTAPPAFPSKSTCRRQRQYLDF